MISLDDLLLSPQASIRDVIGCINRSAKGIALVVDQQRRLLATITDGDIRRAILAEIDLELPVQTLLDCLEPPAHRFPLKAPAGTPDTELLRMMNQHTLCHIPLVDSTDRVVGVALLSELVKKHELPLNAVIMAGGYGKRLRPLTSELPKPMLPMGDRPLLELIIDQLCRAGIRRVNLTTHYKGEIIARHFGDGSYYGVELNYVHEEHPLGTAGALSLLAQSKDPLLVMNGDILTQVDFRAMLDFHRLHQADMTVAVRQYELRLPYGVINTCGNKVISIAEKPTLQHFINAGIYLLNPDVCRIIPVGQSYDMTELIECLVASQRCVVSFPIYDYWQDIGQVEDYRKAVKAVSSGELF